MAPSTPPSEEDKRPDQGKDTTTYIDKVLDGISALGTNTGMQKTWHLTQVPDLELSELSLSFPDFGSGMIDTDVLCEIPVPAVTGLCQQLDAQDNSTISLIVGQVVDWDSPVSAENYTSSGSPAPTLATVGGKQYVSFDGIDDTMAEQNAGASCVSRPGTNDWTAVMVFRSTNTGRGFMWGYSTARRWFLRIAANGSDIEFNTDDDTTSVLLTANDVDFANDDVYVIFAQKDTSLRFYYGNGGALAESAASPVALPGGYGSLTAPTNARLGDAALITGQFFDGEIGECRMYDHSLSAAERAIVYPELVTKWSL